MNIGMCLAVSSILSGIIIIIADNRGSRLFGAGLIVFTLLMIVLANTGENIGKTLKNIL